MRIVLVGAGHAHLYVARNARRLVERGVEVVLVDPGSFWYSGMAAEMIAGQISPTALQVDPKRLIEAAGGHFVADRVVAIDPSARRIEFATLPPMPFDLLSLNVGSVVDTSGFTGAQFAMTAKPISGLAAVACETIRRRESMPESTPVHVVGGGATGCEIAGGLAAHLRQRGIPNPISIVTSASRLLPTQHPAVGELVQKFFRRRGIGVHCTQHVVELEPHAIRLAGGTRIPSLLTVLATGLKTPAILAASGLPTDADGALRVSQTLVSTSDARVFAVGDCAAIEGYDLPRLGVYAVRAAPVLFANLLSHVVGGPLREYHPQRRALSIVNLGDGTGLTLWGSWHHHGRLDLWIKRRIDRSFLARYQG